MSKYQQPWFADIAARDWWRLNRSIEARGNGKVVSYLQYSVSLKGGILPLGAAPPWSHLSGPIVEPSLNSKEKSEVLNELVAKLPRWISLRVVCSPEDDNNARVEAFKAAGFEHTQEPTYRERPHDPDVMDPDNVAGFDKKRRGNIRRAEKKVAITEDLTASAFTQFYADNLIATARKCHSPLDVLRQIIEVGSALDLDNRFFTNDKGEKQAAKRIVLFAAREKSGPSASPPLVAAIACLFDDTHCYYWLTTRRHSSDLSGQSHDDIVKALVIRARQRARDLGLTFDADGVSTPGTERLYTLLKFPHQLKRDVFVRHTPLFRFAKHHQNAIRKVVEPLRSSVGWLRPKVSGQLQV
jgi:hypothetical protein